MKIKDFNSKDWVNYGRWVQPTISGCFWTYWNKAKSITELTNERFNPILFLAGNTLVSITDQKKVALIIKEHCSDKKNIVQFTNHIKSIGAKYEKLHLDLLSSGITDLKIYLEKLFYTYNELVGFWWLSIMFGDELQKYALQNKLVITEEELSKKVSPLIRKTWIEEQTAEIKELAKVIMKMLPTINTNIITKNILGKYPKLLSKITCHVDKFTWFGTHHWMGEPYTLDKCLNSIKEELDKSPQKKLTKLVNNNDNDSNGEIWKLFGEISYWRTHCAEVSCKVIYVSRPKLNACAKKFNISYEQLLYLSSKEITEKLSSTPSKIFLLPNNFPRRQTDYGCYNDEYDNEFILTGETLNILMGKLIPKIQTSVSQVKGLVACKGNVNFIKGQVKIIISPKDFSNFRPMDILVAPETTPDFVPLMKIASAIITDRGGITSHAAIISREIGITCIVGTKIATKVFKDGDEVEVDASKGVIRKI